MDHKGLEKINHAIRGGSQGMRVERDMSPEDTRSFRFITIGETGTWGGDPGEVNSRLDSKGLMFHEGQIVTAETEGPVLKYLGSNGCYHAYEDVASK